MTVQVFDGLSAGEHAATAADAIRAINHITTGGDGLDDPADAYTLLSDLMVMAARLPQALDQIARHLTSMAGRATRAPSSSTRASSAACRSPPCTPARPGCSATPPPPPTSSTTPSTTPATH